MLRHFVIAAALATGAIGAPAFADQPAAPTAAATPTPASTAPASTAATRYTTADTPIGTLLDDPAAKAVLDQHLPGFSSQAQLEMARGMSLKAVQQYAADKVTDEALAKIDADLAKLPPKS